MKISKCIFNKHPYLVSDRLIFKEFDISYSNDLFKIRSNDDVMQFMDVEKMKNIDDAKLMIENILNDFKNKSGLNFAIIEKKSNKFVGYFGFWRLMLSHYRAEIGFALTPYCWNKGYMSEAMSVMIDFTFKEFKLHSLEANVNPNNLNCIKLMKKNGFKQEAYFRENYFFNGKFIDSVIFSLLEKDTYNL